MDFVMLPIEKIIGILIVSFGVAAFYYHYAVVRDLRREREKLEAEYIGVT